MSELQLTNPSTWPRYDAVDVRTIPSEDMNAWSVYAVCATTDPDAYFPEKGGSAREAKKTCLTCEVRPQCLEYALDNDERFGIWGGLSERERRKLRKGGQQLDDEADEDDLDEADEPVTAVSEAA